MSFLRKIGVLGLLVLAGLALLAIWDSSRHQMDYIEESSLDEVASDEFDLADAAGFRWNLDPFWFLGEGAYGHLYLEVSDDAVFPRVPIVHWDAFSDGPEGRSRSVLVKRSAPGKRTRHGFYLGTVRIRNQHSLVIEIERVLEGIPTAPTPARLCLCGTYNMDLESHSISRFVDDVLLFVGFASLAAAALLAVSTRRIQSRNSGEEQNRESTG